MGSNVKIPARQKGKISPEDWEAIQAYKADLKREMDRIEEAERQRRGSSMRPIADLTRPHCRIRHAAARSLLACSMASMLGEQERLRVTCSMASSKSKPCLHTK
jgi:hypothetical protein